MNKKAAVICSSGIGDALILSIASHHLKKLGATVTTFHKLLPNFGRWLEEGDYRPLTNSEELLSFDLIILQHDNTPLAHSIASLRKKGLPIYILYPNYRPSKHGELTAFDYAFNEEKTMVDNLCDALKTLFGGNVTKRNALTPPTGLVYRKHPNRIALHPTSGAAWRNWPKERFLALAERLKKMGLEPQFLLSPKEHADWPHSPYLPTLEEFSSYLYESGAFIGNNSGPGHLASYLSIPHIILAHQDRHMKLWKPGWMLGTCLLPPKWIPNWKGLRWREKYWNKVITKYRVLNNLEHMLIS
jgi:ADP-heptose:LPS heptosyltransferase